MIQLDDNYSLPEREGEIVSNRAIYENLAGSVCACGAEKKTRQSFCRVDYFRLPAGLRRQLYEIDGYPETFRRALQFLGLPEPTSKERIRNEKEH